MAKAKIEIAESRGRVSIRTGTGFRLEDARFGFEVSGSSAKAGKVFKSGIAQIRQLTSNAIQFSHRISNAGTKPLRISSVTAFDGTIQAEGAGWQVVHAEMFMRERYFDGYTYLTQGFFTPLESCNGEYGLSESFPFPGLIFHHPERGTVLFSVLSQNYAKPFWTIRAKGRRVSFRGDDFFHGIPFITVAPGEEFATEDWVVLFGQNGIDAIIRDYYKLLTRRVKMVGKNSILSKAIVWGSWNYNRRPRGHRDIDHKWIVANARKLTKIASNKPRFIMIDDGYQFGGSKVFPGMSVLATAFEIFYDDGNPPHDPKLFPKGMKGLADDIRKAGCEPALWITPRINRSSSLAKEHPEWLLDMGHKDSDLRVGRFLDYSLPEVREYIRQVWNTVFNVWGYKAVKMDFWSIQFEVPTVRFRNKDRTAMQLREQFLADLREFVPADGYVVTGCCINTGNPFIGKYMDAARSALDIGDGTPDSIRSSATILTSSTAFYRHDAFLNDPDSIGWNPDISANLNYLWATLAMMCGAMCEIAGDLNTLTPEGRKLIDTAIRFHKPATATHSTVFSGGTNAIPASHLVLERPDATYEAWLNWDRYPREVELAKPVTDIWTGARLKDRTLIPPLSAIFFKVS